MNKFNKEELNKILTEHKLWLNTSGKEGKRADLSGADLTEADLTGANLIRANLFGADLRWAHLSGAKLTWANLIRADLTEADLTGADLRGVDLRGADLTRCKGIIGFYLGKHFGFMWINKDKEKIVKIGCKESTLDQWLTDIIEIGLQNNYNEREIENYNKQLKFLKEYKYE